MIAMRNGKHRGWICTMIITWMMLRWTVLRGKTCENECSIRSRSLLHDIFIGGWGQHICCHVSSMVGSCKKVMYMKNTLHIVYIYIHVGSIESPNSYTYTTKQRCRYSHSPWLARNPQNLYQATPKTWGHPPCWSHAKASKASGGMVRFTVKGWRCHNLFVCPESMFLLRWSCS